MKVRFACPTCDYPGSRSLDEPTTWRCPRCDHLQPLKEPPHTVRKENVIVEECAVCENPELYKMKGFPHWLGMSILVIACLAFLYLHGRYEPYWAWGILLGSALIDGLMYLWVPDVVTCYRCGARHSGMRRAGNEPFELTIHERYRHEQAQATLPSGVTQQPEKGPTQSETRITEKEENQAR